jgi:hypothetical protein
MPLVALQLRKRGGIFARPAILSSGTSDTATNTNQRHVDGDAARTGVAARFCKAARTASPAVRNEIVAQATLTGIPSGTAEPAAVLVGNSVELARARHG